MKTSRVLDVVMMGHAEMWEAMSERDAIYANPDASEEDYMRAADLEATFAEYDGYTAEARAGELLFGVGIAQELQQGLMSAVAPGFKLRVLLAQALFSNPDILLLDEPTNNLDINTIRWLEDVLNARNCTMVIISHDRHFLNSVCTHMADLDYGKITIYPGNYDDYMMASTQAREQQAADNAKAKEKVAELKRLRGALLGQRLQGQAGHLARAPDRQDQDRGLQAFQPPVSFHPLRIRRAREAAPRRGGAAEGGQGLRQGAVLQRQLPHRCGREGRHHRPQRHR